MKNFKSVLFLFFLMVISASLIFAAEKEKNTDEQEKSKNKKEETAQPTPKEIDWKTYPEGLILAASNDKQIFIDFSTSWCGWCKKMDRETFTDPTIIKMLSDNFSSVRVTGDSKKQLNIDGYKISERDLTSREFGVRGFPAFWFLESDGSKIAPLSGYQPAETFMKALAFVFERQYKSDKDDSKQKKQP